MRLKCILIYALFVLTAHTSTHAQRDQFNDTRLNQLIDSLSKEHDYSETKSEWRLKPFDTDKPEKEITPSTNNNRGLSAFTGLKYIFYVLILAGLIFVVVLVIRGNRNLKVNLETEIKPLETEDELINYDSDRAYKEALAAKNYRLALRVQFIRVLQYLTIKKAIKWKPDKTNRDYTRELRGQEDFQYFKTLSAAFEQIWYGNQEITEDEFRKYDQHFAHYLNKSA